MKGRPRSPVGHLLWQSPALPDGALEHALLRERLLDIAYDVSSYLRRHSQPAVRISTALLVAASLAACRPSEAPTTDFPTTVSPLAEEVRTGLPTAPGRYAVANDSVVRDARGVYHFSWLEPGVSTGTGTPASVSRVKLAESNTSGLEIPEAGDPVLHLRRDTPIALSEGVVSESRGAPRGSDSVYWRPFFVGGIPYGPGYYDPPSRTLPSTGTVDGASASAAPRPLAERTFGLSRAVSGRAGGTGAGTAATTKSGGSIQPVGGKSAAAAPKSSSFSSGRSASTSGSSVS